MKLSMLNEWYDKARDAVVIANIDDALREIKASIEDDNKERARNYILALRNYAVKEVDKL